MKQIIVLIAMISVGLFMFLTIHEMQYTPNEAINKESGQIQNATSLYYKSDIMPVNSWYWYDTKSYKTSGTPLYDWEE